VLALVLAGVSHPAVARETPVPTGGPLAIPATLDAAAARAGADRCLAWLVAHQRPDGAWGHAVPGESLEAGFSVETHYCWQVTACLLATMALADAPAQEDRQEALRRAIDWWTASRLPQRGSEWDTDFMWPALYGVVAAVHLQDHPRLADDAPRRAALRERGRAFLGILLDNQAPLGGWAYYDDPPWSRRNKWATSFCTALVLPALARARELGWFDDARVVDRAVRYVERCRLPNGAFQYSLDPVPWISGGEHINQVKGSLGRIQVCQWALHALGRPQVTHESIRTGLEAFFEHHRFLDTARMRPIPHEGHYANAGYFYNFGHYYAAQAIGRLPAEEREAWHARLRPHVIKTLRKDGSTSDFLGAAYMLTASTAYAAMTLEAGLPRSPPEPESPAGDAGDAEAQGH
jgi:hypothetical protein